MMQKWMAAAADAIRPLAKAVLAPLLRSNAGERVGAVSVARRLARQWAASAGLYDLPASPEAHTSPAAPAPAPSAVGPIEPRAGEEQREVVVYVSRKHSSCKAAKRILDELAIRYREIDLSDDEQGRERLYRDTQDRTFPQIFIDGRRLGGFDDLVVAREEGRLRDLLYPKAGRA